MSKRLCCCRISYEKSVVAPKWLQWRGGLRHSKLAFATHTTTNILASPRKKLTRQMQFRKRRGKSPWKERIEELLGVLTIKTRKEGEVIQGRKQGRKAISPKEECFELRGGDREKPGRRRLWIPKRRGGPHSKKRSLKTSSEKKTRM